MPPERRDDASLWDMLQATTAAMAFTEGVSLEQFGADRMRERAVEREIEIIGEAARRLSEAFRAAHPEVPWRQIVSLRNLIAHGYDAVDAERIWRLTQQDLPTLLTQLHRLAPPQRP